MGNPFSKTGYISLRGHQQVASARFLPNGKLVTAGDTTMRLWNPETGKAEKVWKFSSPVGTCCCSPDGYYIACGVVDGLVFIFESRTQQQVAVWEAHANCRQGPLLQFFADSTYVLSGAQFTCKIWSARTSKLINTWDTTLMTSLKIAPDYTVLAVGGASGVVTVHNLPDGSALRRIHAHRSEIWALDFSSDRTLLVTGSRDEPDGLKLWQVETWELLQTLRGHAGLVLDCAFSLDGSQLVTCGFDRTLQIWSPRGGSGGAARVAEQPGQAGSPWHRENVLVGHSDAILTCAFAPGKGSALVASGCRDGTVRAWRLADVPRFTGADAVNYGLPMS